MAPEGNGHALPPPGARDGAGEPGAPEGRGVEESLRAGDRAYKASNFAEAVRCYAHAAAQDGHSAEAWHHLGNARWRRGDREGAIEAYERTVAERATWPRAWHNLATAYLAASRFSKAVQAAAKSVALDPKRAKAWNNLAVARQGIRDIVGAEAALRHAIKMDAEFGTAWGNLGRLLLGTARPGPAAEAFRKAIATGDGGAASRLGLARALDALGDGPGAEAALAEGVGASPNHVEVWLALGDVRLSHGNPGGALAAFEGAAAAASDMGDAVRADAAKRTRLAALAVAKEAVLAGDRPLLLKCLDHLRTATADAAQAGAGDEPSVEFAVQQVVAAAAKAAEAGGAARADMSPAWVSTVVGSAVRRASTPPPDRGNGA